MPLVVTYRGEPVKRRKRRGDWLFLWLYAKEPGQPSRVIRVSQKDWERDGRETYVDGKIDIRSLVREA